MKETPQQKYQRLLHEVQELTTEVERIKVTSGLSASSALRVWGCKSVFSAVESVCWGQKTWLSG